jgi:nicotinate-nucleotide adenylyltransferase
MRKSVGILGGSFNPVHIGHIRLAVEVKERLGLDSIDLVPTARPPHKSVSGLLPLETRLHLLELAIKDIPFLKTNDLEGRRAGASYTWDTLAAYRNEDPDREIFFILGTGDLLTLPLWSRGLELLSLAHFVTIPRAGIELERIRAFLDETTQGKTHPIPSPIPTVEAAWQCSKETTLLYLPVPRLDVSSSLVREAWREGRNVSCLLPPGVEKTLREQKEEIDNVWKK